MSNKNTFSWEPTKLQIDEFIISAYKHLSTNCVSCIKKLYYLTQYIDEMLRDLADSIMTSYPKLKEKNIIL